MIEQGLNIPEQFPRDKNQYWRDVLHVHVQVCHSHHGRLRCQSSGHTMNSVSKTPQSQGSEETKYKENLLAQHQRNTLHTSKHTTAMNWHKILHQFKNVFTKCFLMKWNRHKCAETGCWHPKLGDMTIRLIWRLRTEVFLTHGCSELIIFTEHFPA